MYEIKMELVSETIFGSGESMPAEVDMDVVTDEYGIPYLKGKTFKGIFREKLEFLVQTYGLDKKIVDLYLGTPNSGLAQYDNVIFSDFNISEDIKNVLVNEVKNGLSVDELKEAFTNERCSIRVDENGMTEDGSLRTERVINKGIDLFSELIVPPEYEDKDIMLLAAAASLVNTIGTKRTRGKGKVRTTLLKDGEKVLNSHEDLKKALEV